MPPPTRFASQCSRSAESLRPASPNASQPARRATPPSDSSNDLPAGERQEGRARSANLPARLPRAAGRQPAHGRGGAQRRDHPAHFVHARHIPRWGHCRDRAHGRRRFAPPPPPPPPPPGGGGRRTPPPPRPPPPRAGPPPRPAPPAAQR